VLADPHISCLPGGCRSPDGDGPPIGVLVLNYNGRALLEECLPSVLAAGVFQLYKARHELLGTQQDTLALGIATLVSGIVGYASIAFLLRYLQFHTTYVFVVYRLIVGGLILYWLSSGVLTSLASAGV